MPNSDTKRAVHVVDDDRLFRDALERTLRTAGLTVKTHACASDFLASIDMDQSGCLVTDLRMPDMDGLDLQKKLHQKQIRMPVIFITGHGEARHAVSAMKGGAVDFLEKPFSAQTLLESVHRALDQNASDRKLAGEQTIVKQRFVNLSAREQQVFALVVSDLPNKEIARRLQISPRTVEHHREHVRLKMQARSVPELITMAVLCGIHELHL